MLFRVGKGVNNGYKVTDLRFAGLSRWIKNAHGDEFIKRKFLFFRKPAILRIVFLNLQMPFVGGH